MRRARLAIGLNLVIPGGGMILLRREWLGFLTAVFFSVLVNTGIFGFAIAPRSLPVWITWAAAVGAVVVWLLAQWRTWVLARIVESPELAGELDHMARKAGVLLQAGHANKARRMLRLALALNDEHIPSLRGYVLVYEKEGNAQAAEKWRRRLHQLEPEENTSVPEATVQTPAAPGSEKQVESG